MTPIARTFEVATATVQAKRDDEAPLAWLLAAMYWRGARHPAALSCAPLHPPTRLVGWLNGFDVCQQVDQLATVLALLAAEVIRIERRSHLVIAALLARTRGGRIVLLPELLAPARRDRAPTLQNARRNAEPKTAPGSRC